MSTARIGCRWEHEAEAAMERAGFEIIDRGGISDYQGWGVLLGRKNGNQYAVLGWSYGSCNYCDSYEDMSDEARAREFDGKVERYSEADARVKFDERKGW